MIIYNSRVPKVCSWFFPVAAITIGPCIFIKKNNAPQYLINHEQIHVAQGRELYYIGFWLVYLFYFLRGLIKNGAYDAYLDIPFEREAYDNQPNLGYLIHRKRNAWLAYREKGASKRGENGAGKK